MRGVRGCSKCCRGRGMGMLCVGIDVGFKGVGVFVCGGNEVGL